VGCGALALAARLQYAHTERPEIHLMGTEPPPIHGAFFEALADLVEHGPEWRVINAGLVALGLVDAWFRDGERLSPQQKKTADILRADIAQIEQGNIMRPILGALLNAVEQALPEDGWKIGSRLMAYARALQFVRKWALAADVYDTVLSYTSATTASDIVMSAMLQLARCLRMLERWDEAVSAYHNAGETARRAGDSANEFRAHMGEAALAVDRGDLKAGAAILDRLIVATGVDEFSALHALALHDRGEIAYRLGEYEAAIGYFHRALDGAPSQAERERVLAGLAAAFFNVGLLDASRDANLMLAETAQEQYTRWVAAINLIEIAAAEGSEVVFERFRRELANASLPPTLQGEYAYQVGQGYRMLGQDGRAEQALALARGLAEQHNSASLLERAASALHDLSAGVVLRTHVAQARPSPRVMAAVDAIGELYRRSNIRD
jgi:tetratricopeptide (TPR) repeat protein